MSDWMTYEDNIFIVDEDTIRKCTNNQYWEAKCLDVYIKGLQTPKTRLYSTHFPGMTDEDAAKFEREHNRLLYEKLDDKYGKRQYAIQHSDNCLFAVVDKATADSIDKTYDYQDVYHYASLLYGDENDRIKMLTINDYLLYNKISTRDPYQVSNWIHAAIIKRNKYHKENN